MKVSMVSVSRRAGPPHSGQDVFTNSSWKVRGDSPVGLNSGVFRQEHRKLVLGDGDYAAGVAIDHRYRGSPIPLAGYEPITDTVRDCAATDALLIQGPCNRLLTLFVTKAHELARVDHLPGPRYRLPQRSSPPHPGGAITVLIGRSYFLA